MVRLRWSAVQASQDVQGKKKVEVFLLVAVPRQGENFIDLRMLTGRRTLKMMLINEIAGWRQDWIVRFPAENSLTEEIQIIHNA